MAPMAFVLVTLEKGEGGIGDLSWPQGLLDRKISLIGGETAIHGPSLPLKQTTATLQQMEQTSIENGRPWDVGRLWRI